MLHVMSRGKVLSHFHDDLGLVDAMDNKVAARHDCTAFDDFGHVCLRPSNTGGCTGRRHVEWGSTIGGCPLPALERGHRAPHKLLNDPLAAAEPAVLRLPHPGPGCA